MELNLTKRRILTQYNKQYRHNFFAQLA